MSKENTRKRFGQLLSSPTVSRGGRFKRKQTLRFRERDVRKQQGIFKYDPHGDEFKIDDASDDETGGSVTASINERGQLHASHPSSMPASINPAEVTIDRRHVSGSEIESLSEGEARGQSESSSDASESDDCTAIYCKKTKMTPLSFADKRNFKRRRITDDMDVTCSTKSATKTRPVPQDIFKLKSFKPIGLNRTALGSTSNVSIATLTTSCGSATKSRWKDLDKSFSEQTFDCIEELPPSPEDESIRGQSELLGIEELPSSAEDACKERSADSGVPATTFYAPSLANSSKSIKYSSKSPLATLANVLREKHSKRNFWQHELQAGLIHHVTVVRIESIERSYGRVMLRFFTALENAVGADEEVQPMENIVYLDPSDTQLKAIQAGMDVAFEADERISPHKISPNRQVHLGVAKIYPILSISK